MYWPHGTSEVVRLLPKGSNDLRTDSLVRDPESTRAGQHDSRSCFILHTKSNDVRPFVQIDRLQSIDRTNVGECVPPLSQLLEGEVNGSNSNGPATNHRLLTEEPGDNGPGSIALGKVG